MIYHLAPTGIAGFVLANGSMSSNQSGEGEIRRNIIEADLVDCMVALPGQLFYSTQIPACLWFLRRDKRRLPSPSAGKGGGEIADRRGQVLFIDARKLGRMVDRTHRELTDEDIARIAGTYHAWRSDVGTVPNKADARTVRDAIDVGMIRNMTDVGAVREPPLQYADIPGFCKSAMLEEIRKHGYVLTPGRYVGAVPQEDDGEPFAEKMQRLTAQWREQQAQARKLDAAIAANLKELGYDS